MRALEAVAATFGVLFVATLALVPVCMWWADRKSTR